MESVRGVGAGGDEFDGIGVSVGEGGNSYNSSFDDAERDEGDRNLGDGLEEVVDLGGGVCTGGFAFSFAASTFRSSILVRYA